MSQKIRAKYRLYRRDSRSPSDVSISLDKWFKSLIKKNHSSLLPPSQCNYVRMLRWYEKEGNQLMGELPLPNIELTELQELFQESPDNLMFECYVIGPQQADYFQQKINQKLDLNSYDYFIDCDAL